MKYEVCIGFRDVNPQGEDSEYMIFDSRPYVTYAQSPEGEQMLAVVGTSGDEFVAVPYLDVRFVFVHAIDDLDELEEESGV